MSQGRTIAPVAFLGLVVATSFALLKTPPATQAGSPPAVAAVKPPGGGLSVRVTNLVVLSQHTGPVECVAFSLNKRFLISGGADEKVMIWPMAECTSTGKPKIQEFSQAYGINAVAFDNDDGNEPRFVVSASKTRFGNVGGSLRVTGTVHPESNWATGAIGGQGYRSCAVHPTLPLVVSGGTDGDLRVFNLTPLLANGLLKKLPLSEYEVRPAALAVPTAINCVAFRKKAMSAAAQIATGTQDGSIRLYEINDRGVKLRKNLGVVHLAAIQSISYTKDSVNDLIVSQSADGVVHFWNAEDGSPIVGRTITVGQAVNHLVASEDATLLAVALKAGGVRLYDGQAGKLLGSLDAGEKPVNGLALLEGRSPNVPAKQKQSNKPGAREWQLAAACGDYSVKLWTISSN